MLSSTKTKQTFLQEKNTKKGIPIIDTFGSRAAGHFEPFNKEIRGYSPK
jgi:hypothetical protein